MRKNRHFRIAISLALALILMISCRPVEAHSLSWGVLPAQVFEYSADGNRQDIGAVDIDFSMTIESLETIPASPVFTSDFPRTIVTLRNLDGGSTLDMGNDIAMLSLPFYAMPIGDWAYLSTVVEAYSDAIREVVAFQNTTHWGYSNNGEWPDDRVLKTTIYLKENGMMAYYSGSHWSFSQQLMIEDVTIERLSPPTTTTTTTPTTTSTTPTDTGTTTPTETTTPPPTTPPGQEQLDPGLKFSAIGMSATVFFAVLGLVVKSELIEKRKHKIAIIIVGVLIYAGIAAVIWIIL